MAMKNLTIEQMDAQRRAKWAGRGVVSAAAPYEGTPCALQACKGPTKLVRVVDAEREEVECLDCGFGFITFNAQILKDVAKGIGPEESRRIRADARRLVLGEAAKALKPPAQRPRRERGLITHDGFPS